MTVTQGTLVSRKTRHLLALSLALVLLLVGCGGGSTGPSQSTGTLAFTLDPATCAGTSGNIELFIDSASQGIFAFTAGASKGFIVAAGPHVAGALESGGSGVNFGSRQVSVPAGGTYTVTMACQ